MNTRIRNLVVMLTGLAAVIGLWLAVSPQFVPFPANVRVIANMVVVGFSVAFLSGINASQPERASWLAWGSGILGVWALVSPWALSFSKNIGAASSCVVAGTVVAAASFWAATMARKSHAGNTTSNLHLI